MTRGVRRWLRRSAPVTLWRSGALILSLGPGRRGALRRGTVLRITLPGLEQSRINVDAAPDVVWRSTNRPKGKLSVRVRPAAPAAALVGLSDAAKPSPVPPPKMQRADSGYHKDDALLVDQMRALIIAKTARNRWDAAGMLAPQAKGAGGFEAKRRRLSDRYAETYGEVDLPASQ